MTEEFKIGGNVDVATAVTYEEGYFEILDALIECLTVDAFDSGWANGFEAGEETASWQQHYSSDMTVD